MDTLADFLIARIAEDEAEISPDDDPNLYNRGEPWLLEKADSYSLIGMTVARARAECEAKRRIVSYCDTVLRGVQVGQPHRSDDAQVILRALALPYAEHPDYRDEWRV